MNAVDVIAVGLSRMMEEILIGALNDRIETRFVGSYENVEKFLKAPKSGEPDIVLVGNPGNDFRDLVCRFPGTQFVCIEENGKTVNIWRLTPYRVWLGEVSPDYLADYLVGVHSSNQSVNG